MGSVQIEQKSYEMPRERGSALRISSPSPTSSEALRCKRRCREVRARGQNTGFK